jgi:nucleoside-diphosphate-sugar epimerase
VGQLLRKGLVYTSGYWVHGADDKNYISDTAPPTNPLAIVAWRVSKEQDVLTNSVYNGIVIRPSVLYGRSASFVALLFKTAYEGKAVWPGSPGGRLATIHQDDLADLYLRVVEKSPTLGGIAFDGSNPMTESIDDVLQSLVKISGAKGYEHSKVTNGMYIYFVLSWTVL